MKGFALFLFSTIIMLICSCSSPDDAYSPVWLRCTTEHGSENYVGNIHILQGVTKNINIDFRRQKADYEYIWMGFVQNGDYKTDPKPITSYGLGDNIHNITIPWEVPVTADIPSGFYTLYVAMGDQVNGEYIERTSAKAEDRCTEYSAGGGGSGGEDLQVSLEFLSDYPINYKIEDQQLFQIEVRTKLDELTASEDYWVRVFLEVEMPGVATPFYSNYYTYWETHNDFWQDITLEFGGGAYDWSGAMEIKAHVKIYDTWPGGNEIPSNINKVYPFDNTITHFGTLPTLTQIDVEYDQQIGENLFDEILSGNPTGSSDYIDAAYAPALKKIVFHKDLQHQAIPEEAINLSSSSGAIAAWNYIKNHHNNINRLYLSAVSGIIDDNGDILPGVNVELEDLNTGEIMSGTFVDYNMHISQQEPYVNANLDGFKEFILTGTVAHEIGHALGIQSQDHNSGHTEGNIFCIMYQGYLLNIEPNMSNRKRSLYPNVHFCQNHINELNQ